MKSASAVCTGLPDQSRYTFRMNVFFWLLLAAFAATLVGIVWYVRRKSEAHRLAEEARVAAFVSSLSATPRLPAGAAEGSAPSPALAPARTSSAAANGIALQKLLFDAAHKAGEAGEPALAIQLYARLLARYPESAFAEQVRIAVEAAKKRLLRTNP